jgi:hypothetical protein
MTRGWLRAARNLWLAALLALGSAAAASAAEPPTPEARFEAELSAWRTAAEPDGAALLGAFLELPDLEARMDVVDDALVASMVEDQPNLPAAMAAVEEALDRGPVSLALHARAMTLAADLEDAGRAAQAERAVAALATAYADSGDGTARRPWRVLSTVDALTFVALRGGETLGRRLIRGGDGVLFVVYVAEARDGGESVVAERVFSLRIIERIEAALAARGMPAFARYASLLSALVREEDIAGASSFLAMALTSGAELRPEAAALATGLQANEEFEDDLFARGVLAAYRIRRKDTSPMPGSGAVPLDELIALAERGLPSAIGDLAELIDAGLMPDMVAADATELMRVGAERGSPSLALGLAYGMQKDGKQADAEHWMGRAIDFGSLEAVGQLGWWRLEHGPLDEPLAGQVRAAAARGEAFSMVVEALRALRAGSDDERTRGRALLLAAPRNANHGEVGNDVAYELALGTSRAPRDGALAAEIMTLNFELHPYVRDKASHLDTHAVALLAAGRRDEGLAMLARALALLDGTMDADSRSRFIIGRHAARVRAGGDITEATDREDHAAWEAQRNDQH